LSVVKLCGYIDRVVF